MYTCEKVLYRQDAESEDDYCISAFGAATGETELHQPAAESEADCSNWAFAAATCGVMALVFWWLWLPAPLLGAFALLFGVKGLLSIRKSEGRLDGRAFAVSGIVLGLATLLVVLVNMLTAPKEQTFATTFSNVAA